MDRATVESHSYKKGCKVHNNERRWFLADHGSKDAKCARGCLKIVNIWFFIELPLLFRRLKQCNQTVRVGDGIGP